MIHFHICWSASKVDWETFQTRENAVSRAKELVLPGETFMIEQFDGACPHCKTLRTPKFSSHRQNNETWLSMGAKQEANKDTENCLVR